MATTEVRRDNRGLWIALAVIAVLAVLAVLFLSANNRNETAALDAATTDVAVADLDGAGAATTDAARDAAASASAAAASARDAAADAAADTTDAAEDRLSVNVGPDGTTVSGTASTD